MDLSKYGVSSDNKILGVALTHTSYANEHNVPSYERLEYLGDAVLELIMSEYLYNNTDYSEGFMTKMRAHYVCENALYEYSLKLGLLLAWTKTTTNNLLIPLYRTITFRACAYFNSFI